MSNGKHIVSQETLDKFLNIFFTDIQEEADYTIVWDKERNRMFVTLECNFHQGKEKNTAYILTIDSGDDEIPDTEIYFDNIEELVEGLDTFYNTIYNQPFEKWKPLRIE